MWLPIAWIRCVLPRPDAAVDEQRVVRRRVVGDLQARGAGELVRLAGDERREGERRVEARRLGAARRQRRRRAPCRDGGLGGAGTDAASARASAGSARAWIGGARLRRPSAIANSIGDRVARRPPQRARRCGAPKRSFTHCSTKRFGASSRQPVAVAARRRAAGSRCRTAAGVSSRSERVEAAVQASGSSATCDAWIQGLVVARLAGVGQRAGRTASAAGELVDARSARRRYAHCSRAAGAVIHSRCAAAAHGAGEVAHGAAVARVTARIAPRLRAAAAAPH